MNLSSLVHAGTYPREQQYTPYAPRPQQSMPSSLVTGPYAAEQRHSSYPYVSAPQPPPSPPVEEAPKCSLPSISSLLGGLPSDAGSQDEAQPQAGQQRAPQFQQVEYRPDSSHLCNSSPPLSTREALPPTPPMHSDSGFDRRRSPSAASNSGYSVVSAPAYYLSGSVSATTSVDPRQHLPAARRRVSLPAGQVAYSSQPLNGSRYHANSTDSYYSSPVEPSAPYARNPDLYYQRPPPQKHFSPTEPLSASSGANPWQHHHYISPSSAAAFPQSQDRYICQTCSKAFSRPSSLRIHSHSHTGEKPFKCPQRGCGKAFSVRSNMKRHERGCHI